AVSRVTTLSTGIGSRSELSGSGDAVGDQPLTIDPSDVEVGDRRVRDLTRLVVDVVTLEVQRASVAVDRDLNLVCGVIRDPGGVLPERARLRQPELSDLIHSRRRRSWTNREGGVRRPQAHHQIDVLQGRRLVELPLDLID